MPHKPNDYTQMRPKEAEESITKEIDAILSRQVHGPKYDPDGKQTVSVEEFFQVAAATKYLLTRARLQETYITMLTMSVYTLLGVVMKEEEPMPPRPEEEGLGREEESDGK